MIVDLSGVKFFCTRCRKKIVYHKEVSCANADGLSAVMVLAGRCPMCARKYVGKIAKSYEDWEAYKKHTEGMLGV
jgi:hypothetical protein